jgi:ribosomal protein S18 acetylase RimI-like enzyme
MEVAADRVAIGEATEDERIWAARLMASSEPWITLGRGFEACREASLDPACVVLVARRDGVPCGFIRVHPRGVAGSAYVASIAVAAPERGQGFGAVLLDAAERRFAASSRFLFLCVSSFNTSARRFYESHGYRQFGEFPDYVIEGPSELLMGKRIS